MSDLENSTSPHEGLIYGKSPRGKKLLQLRKETIGLFFQRAIQMNHCHLERRGKNLSICKMFNYSLEKSLGTCKSHLRERPANHKPGDGIGPSPDRPENAEATQKMIEKKFLDLRKVSWAVQKLLGAPKVFF